MKLSIRLAWSLAVAAAIAGCGGGGGGGDTPPAGNGGGGITAVTVPACATSDTTQGWLTDYRNTVNPLTFDQMAQGCVTGAYSALPQMLVFPITSVTLTGDNIRAMIGTIPSKTGTAPTFSFYIATPSPSLPSTDSVIELAITKGTDKIRTKGLESQVMITLNVVTKMEGNQLVIRSNESLPVYVNAFTSGNNTDTPDIRIPLTFTNDLIASSTATSGGTVLTVEAFGLLTKIHNDPNASGLFTFLPAGYPTVGDYTFSITKTGGTDLPLKTFGQLPIDQKTINSLSIGLPIQ
jgi:hypothetical protein